MATAPKTAGSISSLSQPATGSGSETAVVVEVGATEVEVVVPTELVVDAIATVDEAPVEDVGDVVSLHEITVSMRTTATTMRLIT